MNMSEDRQQSSLPDTGQKLLEIEHLTVRFKIDEGTFHAVDDVSFHVCRGEIVGIVGESGCGKSVTALSILRLVPSPPGTIAGGRILYDGKDLLGLSHSEMRHIRGKSISMIFQEPLSALSPLHRIGSQLTEAIHLHRHVTGKEAWQVAEKWLGKVGIPDARERMFAYPFQLSGGMQQRIMIAMALMMSPRLVIADEPTTALDVTIQAQIFELIRKMRGEQTSVLLITHDMGVIWEMCDRVVVMYASKIVEEGSVSDLFSRPAHPYTRGLLQSIPILNQKAKRLKAIPGQVPAPWNYPSGCRFRDRCIHAFNQCARQQPPWIDFGNGHGAACFLAEQLTDPIVDS
ncbi:MAG: ABC transporter ATP-binding protein [Oscillospiraceae bacterium]|nr:ABC transporter ATP-binding protein [Oscillospiraceae bacterium]